MPAAIRNAHRKSVNKGDPTSLRAFVRGTIVRGSVVAYLNDGTREEWAGRDSDGRAVVECNTFETV